MNMVYTKNSDPNYFDEHKEDTNCGSFAFNIVQPYYPHLDLEYDIYEVFEECNEWGRDYDDVVEEVAADLDYVIKDDFGEEIESFDCVDDALNSMDEGDEVIAFRFGANDETEFDFHFKVLRGGRWQEKCGSLPAQNCELEPDDPWAGPGFDYDSSIYYYVHKMS